MNTVVPDSIRRHRAIVRLRGHRRISEAADQSGQGCRDLNPVGIIVEGRWSGLFGKERVHSLLRVCCGFRVCAPRSRDQGAVIEFDFRGLRAENPREQGYAAQMAALLGDEYDVEVFALGGHTLLQKTSASLMKSQSIRRPCSLLPTWRSSCWDQ